MDMQSLFQLTKDNSKISKAAAERRCKEVIDNVGIIPAEYHAQLGRMPFGTKQRITVTIKNGSYVYFLRSNFK